MDPGTLALILTALKFVGEEAAKAGVGEAAKGAIHKFAGLVRAKLKGRPLGEQVLLQYASDPETWEAPMRKELVESGAVDDPGIAAAAQQVVMLIGQQNIVFGKNVAVGQQLSVGHLGDQITFSIEQPTQPPGDGGDYFVSGPAFEREHKPELEPRFEVKLPREGEEFAFLRRGWREISVTHRGRKKRLVVGQPGQINSIPVIRKRLSEKAKRLLVAAHRVTNPRFADSIKWHGSDGTFTISGETATGPERRQVYEELMRDGLVRHESEVILRLTEEGRLRAEELISEGY